MKVTLKIPARLALSVIPCAHSMYWLNNYTWRWRTDDSGVYIGKPVKKSYVIGVPKPAKFVGAKQIAAGLVAMLQSGNAHHAQIAARVLAGTADGPDKDILLQYAAYGAVHWG